VVVNLCWALRAGAQEKPNHLSGEHSSYLKRAAGQPVDWHAWGGEAFKLAKELNRPILLDVGAVWCPWCALMDRDTYSQTETADFINQHFVAVKVDFDASPKLVAQLQLAQATLNLPAGLPLTSFITPDGRLQSGFVPGKPNYVIIYGEGCFNSKRQGRRTVDLYNKYRSHVHFVVIDLDVQRSPEQQKLVKQYYKGYIPHVLVLDARGEALYDQSGEVDSEHIEDIFKNSLGH
jgi:thioredoxin-related protein